MRLTITQPDSNESTIQISLAVLKIEVMTFSGQVVESLGLRLCGSGYEVGS